MQIKSDKSSTHLLMGLFAALPILFRGIFFERDFFIFAMVAAILCVCLLFGRSRLIFNGLTDFAIGALVLCYALSLFGAVNTYSAVSELNRYLLFFLIYLVAKNCFNKNEKVISALNIIMYILAFSSLYTLLSATGILGNLNFPGAYSSAEHERWLQGTVQYHNTFGILMLAGFFMACGLNTKERMTVPFFANGIASFLFMFGLLMSYSRGAWLMVPVLFVVFLLLAAPKQKIRFFATGIASLAIVLACMPVFADFVISGEKVLAFSTLLLGILLFTVLYLVCHIIFDKWSQTKNFKKIGFSILAIVIILALLVMFVPALTTLLPAQLADRLSGFSFGGETVKERFVFYGDAFNLYKNHNLIVGNGGSAWAYLYGMYQSYDYATTQAHSYIMQVLVETGMLGFISWIAIILLFVWQCIRARKNELVDKNALAVITCVGIGLILHSFIDFDFSIPAVLCLLWVVFGMLSGISPLSFKTQKILNKWVGVALAALVLVFSVPAFFAAESYENCNQALKDKVPDIKAANQYAKSAASLMPFNYEYASTSLYLRAVNGEKITIKEADDIRKNDPYNKNVTENLFYCYEQLGDFSKTYACLEDIIRLEPKNDPHYLDLINVSKVAMLQELKNGNYEKTQDIAKSYLTYHQRVLDAIQNSATDPFTPLPPKEIEQLTADAKETKLYTEELLKSAPANSMDALSFMDHMIELSIKSGEEKQILARKFGEYASVAIAAMQTAAEEGDYEMAMEIALAVRAKEPDLRAASVLSEEFRAQLQMVIEQADALLSALGGL